MENRLIKITILLPALLACVSCDMFEMRGFVASYESADERFRQSMQWNSMNPSREIMAPTDEYSIFVMGDSHSGGTENLEQFFDIAIREKAQAIVLDGDITMGYESDFDHVEQLLPAQEAINSFLIAGNHDLYFGGWKSFYSHFGSSTYIFTVATPLATDLFICLDSASGTLGSEQTAWLKDILQTSRKNYRRCIIFTHNNVFRLRHTTSTNPPVEELRVWMELMVKFNVDFVIAGHDHVRNEEALGNTVFITMDLLQDGFDNAGYFKLFIKNGQISYEFAKI